jgi:hypothetical protein
MKTIIAAAAMTALAIGTGTAYADGGNVHPDTAFTDLPSVMSHPSHDTGPAPQNNAGRTVSFMHMGGQYAFPPGYKPYNDHAHHVVTLRYEPPAAALHYAGRVVTTNPNHG